MFFRRVALTALAAGGLMGCLGSISDPIDSLVGPNAPNPSMSPSPSVSPSPSASPSASPSPSPSPMDACITTDPGRPTLHRLNRAEYDNTIRDLFAEDITPATEFPPDDHGFGFDNNADVLATSPLLFEKYESAADLLVARALERPVIRVDQRFEAETVGSPTGAVSGDFWNLYTNGAISTPVTVTAAGEYEITARAFGQQAGPDAPIMEIRVDNRVVSTVNVTQVAASPGVFTVRAMLTAGGHTLSVEFTNDFYDEPNMADRNLFVDYLTIAGPDGVVAPDPAKRAAIMICDPAASSNEICARQIFTAFGRKAWRRPLVAEELDRLVALAKVAWDERDPFDVGIGLGIQGIMLSPSFSFRVEVDPSITDTAPHAVSDHELATRLSYFLWSSMPDRTLSDLADRGELARPEITAQQVNRMLRDPKAKALTDNFAGQWLYTRKLESVAPDYMLFPGWSAELGASMKKETEAFFGTFLTSDVSALDMIDADFSFLDDRLARHYGLPLPGAAEPRRVSLPAGARRGLLTQGSVLTVTSHARRTSPVKRGKWVLEQILCSAPPAPPPGVEGIPEVVNPSGSLRERFEAHRSQDSCKGCHSTMDPIGFSLEHFDAIGSWREKDGAFDIDDSAELPNGQTWQGAEGLAQVIKGDPRLSACMTEKLFVYALGRGPTANDKACNIPQLDRAFTADGHRLEALVTKLAQSPAFTQRKAEGN